MLQFVQWSDIQWYKCLTPQGQLSLQGTFGVWTDVKELLTQADEGEAGI